MTGRVTARRSDKMHLFLARGWSVELERTLGLVGSDSSRSDVGFRVNLGPHGRQRLPSHDRELPDVRQHVGNGTLEQLLRRRTERRVRREVSVELQQRRVEAVDFLSPHLRLRLRPLRAALRHSQRPVEEIAHVRKDFDRCPRALAEREFRKLRRCISLYLGCTVRNSRERVPQEAPLGIHQCQSGSSASVSTWTRATEAFPEKRCQPPLLLLWPTAISKLSGGNQRA